MKKLTQTTALLLAILLIVSSCSTKEKSNSDQSADYARLAADREAEQKRAVEAARLAKIHAEQREARISYAADIVNRFTTKYMQTVSPVSGENAQVTIDPASIQYDYDTQTIVFTFESKWLGCPETIFDKKEWHVYTGSLKIYGGSNQLKLETMSENSVLVKAKKANKFYGDVANMIDLYESTKALSASLSDN